MKKMIGIVFVTIMVAACMKGKQGDPGYAGVSGATGITGPRGPQGNPGQACAVQETSPGTVQVTCADGSSMVLSDVTPVALCPEAPVYPSTFPETALCIKGNLYGVYSANDGFLTELEPGVYLSNAIGSTCTLTVSAGCQVQVQ